jgi:DNA-binding ferritin-like protein
MALENVVGRGKQSPKKMVTAPAVYTPTPAEMGNEEEVAQDAGGQCDAIAQACLETGLRFHFFHIHVRSPNFVGLHAFYGEIYESLYGWFDRFAERARAEGEAAADFAPRIPVPGGDCLTEASRQIQFLGAMTAEARASQSETAQAMIDELQEYLGKIAWQVDAQLNP